LGPLAPGIWLGKGYCGYYLKQGLKGRLEGNFLLPLGIRKERRLVKGFKGQEQEIWQQGVQRLQGIGTLYFTQLLLPNSSLIKELGGTFNSLLTISQF